MALRVSVMVGLVACSSGSSTPRVVTKDPTVFGPLGSSFDTVDLDLGARGEGFAARITARVHAPESSTESSPVVVLAHDEGRTITSYFGTASHLAARGFVVVVPQFDTSVNPRSHAGLARDVTAVLDWLPTNPLPVPEGVSPDPRVLGAVGHGRGGKQILLAARAEDRLTALVALDPDDASPEDDAEAYPQVAPGDGIAVPSLLVGTGRALEGCIPEGQGAAAMWDVLTEDAILFELPTAGFNDVLDECGAGSGGPLCVACAAGDEPEATLVFARASAVAFLGSRLQQDDGYAGWLEGEDYLQVLADATRQVKGAP